MKSFLAYFSGFFLFKKKKKTRTGDNFGGRGEQQTNLFNELNCMLLLPERNKVNLKI